MSAPLALMVTMQWGGANMEATSMPKTSGVFDYAGWLIGKLTDEERSKLARSFSYMDLCAGLIATLIAHDAIRRAMDKHGLHIDGRCTGLTELSKDRRDALGRRLGSLGFTAPTKKSNADLTDDVSDRLCSSTSACVPRPLSLSHILRVVLVRHGWLPSPTWARHRGPMRAKLDW